MRYRVARPGAQRRKQRKLTPKTKAMKELTEQDREIIREAILYKMNMLAETKNKIGMPERVQDAITDELRTMREVLNKI